MIVVAVTVAATVVATAFRLGISGGGIGSCGFNYGTLAYAHGCYTMSIQEKLFHFEWGEKMDLFYWSVCVCACVSNFALLQNARERERATDRHICLYSYKILWQLLLSFSFIRYHCTSRCEVKYSRNYLRFHMTFGLWLSVICESMCQLGYKWELKSVYAGIWNGFPKLYDAIQCICCVACSRLARARIHHQWSDRPMLAFALSSRKCAPLLGMLLFRLTWPKKL